MEIAQGAYPKEVRQVLLRDLDPLVVQAQGHPDRKLEYRMCKGTEGLRRVGRKKTAFLDKSVEHAPDARQHRCPRFQEMPIDM